MKKEISEKIIELNKNSYNIIAKHFSSSRNRLWPIMHEFKKLVNPGDRILDLGCGNGRFSELFPSGEYHYFGLDGSSGLITEAQQKYPEYNFNVADFTGELPFPENSFDVVFMFASLNHLPKNLHLQALKNIESVLAPGGRLIMTNFYLWRPSFKTKGVLNYIIKRLKMQGSEWNQKFIIPRSELGIKDVMTWWKSGQTEAPLYYYAFTMTELEALAGKSGFRVERQYHEANGEKVPWHKGRNIVSIWKK